MSIRKKLEMEETEDAMQNSQQNMTTAQIRGKKNEDSL